MSFLSARTAANPNKYGDPLDRAGSGLIARRKWIRFSWGAETYLSAVSCKGRRILLRMWVCVCLWFPLCNERVVIGLSDCDEYCTWLVGHPQHPISSTAQSVSRCSTSSVLLHALPTRLSKFSTQQMQIVVISSFRDWGRWKHGKVLQFQFPIAEQVDCKLNWWQWNLLCESSQIASILVGQFDKCCGWIDYYPLCPKSSWV